MMALCRKRCIGNGKWRPRSRENVFIASRAVSLDFETVRILSPGKSGDGCLDDLRCIATLDADQRVTTMSR